MSYCVLLDENFHYQDPESRWTLGTFDTAEAAISACRKVVDDDLIVLHESGMAADALLAGYRALSDDPVAGAAMVEFSAWDLRRGKMPSHPQLTCCESRQAHVEARSYPDAAFHSYAAAMLDNDTMHHR
jgi:hypothetical protein